MSFSWHLGLDWKFNPDLAKASEVDIRLTAEADLVTLVEREHRGIKRHGEGYEKLREMLDHTDAWAGMLAAFAKKVDGEIGR